MIFKFISGDQEQARDMTLQLIELAPSEERYRRNLEYYTNDLAIPMVSKINNNFTTAHLSRPYDDREWRKKYESLCRGEGTEIPQHLVSQMKCWYHHGRGDRSGFYNFNPHTPDRFTPSHARCAEICGSVLTHR